MGYVFCKLLICSVLNCLKKQFAFSLFLFVTYYRLIEAYETEMFI